MLHDSYFSIFLTHGDDRGRFDSLTDVAGEVIGCIHDVATVSYTHLDVYKRQDFIYASDNLAYLCGLEPEQLMEAGYQMYIDHVPDADLQMLLEVNKKGFDLFNELPVGDRLDYTISYDFHLTNGRHSRLIHHHLTPILLSDDGRIWLALCTVSLAATDEPGHIIMQKNGERSYFEYSTSVSYTHLQFPSAKGKNFHFRYLGMWK